MTLLNTVADLLRHMEWADALVWRTILSSAPATADTALHRRLYHLHVTQHSMYHRGQVGTLGKLALLG